MSDRRTHSPACETVFQPLHRDTDMHQLSVQTLGGVTDHWILRLMNRSRKSYPLRSHATTFDQLDPTNSTASPMLDGPPSSNHPMVPFLLICGPVIEDRRHPACLWCRGPDSQHGRTTSVCRSSLFHPRQKHVFAFFMTLNSLLMSISE